MKIVIVGPGALGCLVAASIKNKMPDEVWLLDRLPERAKSLKDAGLKVEGVS